MFNFKIINFFSKFYLIVFVFVIIFGWGLVSFGATLPVSETTGCIKAEDVGNKCMTPSGRQGTCFFDSLGQTFSCIETAADCNNEGEYCQTSSGNKGVCKQQSEGGFVCEVTTSGVGETTVEGVGKLPVEEGVGKTPVKGSPWTLPNPLNTDSFEGLVRAIAEWLYWIMIPVSAIIFLYAGFMFMTSGGDEEKIKKAKKAIFWGLVGTGIIIINYGFIDLLKDILGTQ